MDYLEREQQKKWRKVWVVCAEIFMVLAVIAITIVMTLVVMGYSFGKDGDIEQSGLMQLHTMPVGATVELDGETLFSRSNLSRSMSPGKHHLKLTKEGYDSWEKDITMLPGALLRLYYPRLFLQERKREEVAKPSELEVYAVAPSRKAILFVEKGSTKWTIINIEGDNFQSREIELAKVLPGVTEEKFSGKISNISWSDNGEKIVAKIKTEEKEDWYLIDLKEPKESFNITKELGMDFSEMRIISASASQILAFENGNLRRIDTESRSISKILLDNVVEFANNGGDIVYISKTKGKEKTSQEIGIYKNGEKYPVVVKKDIDTNSKVHVALSNHYDTDYIMLSVDGALSIYSGELPSRKATEDASLDNKEYYIALDDENGAMKQSFAFSLSTPPNALYVGRSGEFVLAKNGNHFSSVDIDTGDLVEFDSVSDSVEWLDDSMLYAIKDEKLIVWDFDGANQRTIVSGFVENKPVVISSNNNYIYYITTSGELIRERIQ